MGFDHQISTVQYATAALTDLLGTPPRVSKDHGTVRIEFDVTPAATAHWPQVLDILQCGDRFGRTDTPTGPIAWLRLDLGDDLHL